MNDNNFITLKGVVCRTKPYCETDATKRIGNPIVIDWLPVYNLGNRLLERTLIGSAHVAMELNGDIVAKALINSEFANELIGRPFLSAIIEINYEEPARLIELTVADQVSDPHQLPYRIVELPTEESVVLQHGYGAVIIVDEAHEVLAQVNEDGSLEPVFDTSKTRVEYRHSEERRRICLRDAIAGPFGFHTWEEFEKGVEECADSNHFRIANEILDEIIKVI